MNALCDHFSGEENPNRNIAEAERIQDSLYYKNKRSMAFQTFLIQSQKVFNIFEKEGEIMDEATKVIFIHIDLLFKCIFRKYRY